MEIKLRPYQEKLLQSKQHLSSFALFAGTGSGKTYMSLVRAKRNGTSKLLIICPRRVVEQWEESVEKVMPNARIMKFKKSWTAKKKNEFIEKEHNNYDIIILNYEIIFNIPFIMAVVNKNWTIILDESHKIKEVGTKRKPKLSTFFIIHLGEKTDYKIILTATPTQKAMGGYVDYYTQLRFLGYYSMSYDLFCARYVNFKKMNVPGVPFPINVIDGYKRTDEIEDLLKNVSVRYTPSFTDKEPEYIKVNIDKATSYSKFCRQRFYNDLDLTTSSSMRIAKKTLTSGRVSGCDSLGARVAYDDNTEKIDWLMDFIDSCDDNILIFYKYNAERDLIVENLKKEDISHLVIDGNLKDKYLTVKLSNVKVYVGQYNACSESLDGLQFKTHTCVYYSLPESSLEYKQSLGRVYRDGQKFSPNYYFLIMERTIDNTIYDMLMKKVEFSEEILNKLELTKEELMQ